MNIDRNTHDNSQKKGKGKADLCDAADNADDAQYIFIFRISSRCIRLGDLMTGALAASVYSVYLMGRYRI